MILNNLVHLGFLGGSMGGGEILLIMLALLMLFGSKNLPNIARNLGKSMETFRKASRDVTDEIMRADFKDEPPPKKLTSLEASTKTTPEQKEEPALTVTPSVNTVERDEKSGT